MKLAQFLYEQAENSSREKAIKLATAIADKANAPNQGDACELLGLLYDSHTTDSEHKAKSIHYYKRGSDLRDAECITHLAEAYLK